VPAGLHDGPTRPVPGWAKVHEELMVNRETQSENVSAEGSRLS